MTAPRTSTRPWALIPLDALILPGRSADRLAVHVRVASHLRPELDMGDDATETSFGCHSTTQAVCVCKMIVVSMTNPPLIAGQAGVDPICGRQSKVGQCAPTLVMSIKT